jgi:uncharacterized protein (DUF1330 family)
MPTYVVGDIHITDPAAFQSHVPRAMATIARFGGRVIAGGGKIDLLESGPMPERIFIIEFPNADAARRWYRSDEYQAVLKIRLSASHGRVFLIEGTGNFRGHSPWPVWMRHRLGAEMFGIRLSRHKRQGQQPRSRVPRIVAGSIIVKPISHRLFGRKRLRVGFAEVIATLSPSCSVVFRSLMIGID